MGYEGGGNVNVNSLVDNQSTEAAGGKIEVKIDSTSPFTKSASGFNFDSTNCNIALSTNSPALPSGIVHWVPISILTPGSTASNSNYPVRVKVNMSTFSSYCASDLKNVCFIDAAGNKLTSWMESGNSSASTGTIWYVLTLNSNYTGSAIYSIIYLAFASTTTNLHNGTTVGCAPQLVINSSTFGQYDNGTTIFGTGLLGAGIPNYGNFASLPSIFSNIGSATFSNGLQLSGTTTQGIISTATIAANQLNFVLEFYGGSTAAGSSTNDAGMLGYLNNASYGQNVGFIYDGVAQTNNSSDNYEDFALGGLTPTQNAIHVWSTIWGNGRGIFCIDYGTPNTVSTTEGFANLHFGILSNVSANTTATVNSSWYWYRVRSNLQGNSADFIDATVSVGSLDTSSSFSGTSFSESVIVSAAVTPKKTGNIKVLATYSTATDTAGGLATVKIYSGATVIDSEAHNVATANSQAQVSTSTVIMGAALGTQITLKTTLTGGAGTWTFKLLSFEAREVF